MTLMFFLLSLVVHGSPMDSIMESSTVEELLSIEEESVRQRDGERKCREEKQRQAFPKNCFPLLLQIIDISMSRQEWRRKKENLNILCELRSEGLQSLVDLRRLLKLTVLSPGCREALAKREEDLIYISRKEKWPRS